MESVNGTMSGGASAGTPVNLGQLRQELSEFRHKLVEELLGSLQTGAGTIVDGVGAPRLPSADISEISLAPKQFQKLDEDDKELPQDSEWKECFGNRADGRTESSLALKQFQTRDEDGLELPQDLTNPKQLLDRFITNSKAMTRELGKIEDDMLESARSQNSKVARGQVAFPEIGKTTQPNLTSDEYNVETLYFDTGILQYVARSKIFEYISLFVICSNAIYIGVDANLHANLQTAPALVFQIFEQFFCFFFTGEILLRFGAFRNKYDCLLDNWFRFDSALVVLMMGETWVVPFFDGLDPPTAPLLFLRLFRLARLIRLMRSCPELVTMLKGLWVASRAVISSLFLLLLIIYIFAFVVHMVLSAEDVLAERFATLPLCMWTLMMDGILLDSTGEVFEMFFDMDDKFKSMVSTCIMLLFIGVSAITIMNMLIGVLCEVVAAVAQSERDNVAIRLMKISILQELKHFDTNGNGNISKEELKCVMRSPVTLEALGRLDIDVECLHELQQALFTDAEMSIENIMELLLSYRGNLPCTVKHLLDTQVFTRWSLSEQIHVMTVHLDEKLVELAKVHTEVLTSALALQTRKMHNVLTSLSECLPQTPKLKRVLGNRSFAGELKEALPDVEDVHRLEDKFGGLRNTIASSSAALNVFGRISEGFLKDSL